MRAIIITDSYEDMTHLRHMLASIVNNVEVTEYDPTQMGQPAPGFDWSVYNLMLIKDLMAPGKALLARLPD